MTKISFWFEGFDIETSFLVWWYIMTISRVKSEYQGNWGKGQSHLFENV